MESDHGANAGEQRHLQAPLATAFATATRTPPFERTYYDTIQRLELCISVETVKNSWDCRSPHQQNNAKVIKLVTNRRDARAVVCKHVEPALCQQCTTALGRVVQTM